MDIDIALSMYLRLARKERRVGREGGGTVENSRAMSRLCLSGGSEP